MKSIKTIAAVMLAALFAVSCDNSGSEGGGASDITAGTVDETTAFSATITATVNTIDVADLNKGKFGLLYVAESELGGKNAQDLFSNWLQTGELGALKQQKSPSVKPGGIFSVTLTKLHPSSKYYYAGYAELRDGSRYIGDASFFETQKFPLSISTDGTGKVTFYTAVLKGNVAVSASDKTSVEVGMVWADNETPTTLNGKLVPQAQGVAEDGSFEVSIVNLKPGKQYWYRTYACSKETKEYFYGDVKSFTTTDLSEMAVDLGLSVLWASCNLGTEDPYNSGNRYRWGEITPSSSNSKDDYSHYNASDDSWDDLGDISGNPKYDAAAATLGGKWRMPTQDEIAELLELREELIYPNNDQSKIPYIKLNGVKGKDLIIPMVTGDKYVMELYFVVPGEPITGWTTVSYSGGFYHADIWSSTTCRYGINVSYIYSGWADTDDNGNPIVDHSGSGVWDLLKRYELVDNIPTSTRERMFAQKFQLCNIRPVCDR